MYDNLNKTLSLYTKLFFIWWILLLWIMILLIWKEKVKRYFRDLLFDNIFTGLEENVFNSLIYCFRDCEWVKKSRILDFFKYMFVKNLLPSKLEYLIKYKSTKDFSLEGYWPTVGQNSDRQNTNWLLVFCPDLFVVIWYFVLLIFCWYFLQTISTWFWILSEPSNLLFLLSPSLRSSLKMAIQIFSYSNVPNWISE